MVYLCPVSTALTPGGHLTCVSPEPESSLTAVVGRVAKCGACESEAGIGKILRFTTVDNCRKHTKVIKSTTINIIFYNSDGEGGGRGEAWAIDEGGERQIQGLRQ